MLELFEDLFPNHNFSWKKKGQTALGFCPFHNDKRTRSLSIYVDAKGRTRWRCFVDNIGSTEIDAVMHSDTKLTREAANRWLTIHGYMQETEQDAKERYRNSVYDKFYKWTNELLLTDPRAAGVRAYIASRNVRSSLLSIAPIGFYPTTDEVEVWLSQNQVEEELGVELLAPKPMKFAADGAIAFFYRSAYDQYTRIKLRNVMNEKKEIGKTKTAEDVKKEKSVIVLGTKKEKMGYFAPTVEAADAEHAIVVEGEFDALALLSMCREEDPECVESIYCFGGGGSMETGIEVIKNLGVENIYTFPDNDEPGIDYAFQIADAHPHSFIIKPEDYKPGEDPAEWAARSNFDALQETFRQRIPAFSWIGARLAEEATNGSVEEQSHVKTKVLNYAKKLSPTNREMFLKSYAPITGVSYESLSEEVQNNVQTRYRKVFTTDGFGLQQGMVNKKGEINWEPISNCFIERERDILMDDGMGDATRKLVLRVVMATKEATLTVSTADYANETSLMGLILGAIGSDVWIKPRFLSSVKEAAVLLPSSGKQPTEDIVYTHTGWRDGMFLMPNGFVDKDGFHENNDIRVELPPNPSMFTRYKLAQPPADMTYIREIIRKDILEVFPYPVTLPMLAHTFLPPLMAFMPMEKPYCMWVHGLTGSFKTAYTALLNCFWGDFRQIGGY